MRSIPVAVNAPPNHRVRGTTGSSLDGGNGQLEAASLGSPSPTPAHLTSRSSHVSTGRRGGVLSSRQHHRLLAQFVH
jgi:hypothetical protein